MRKILEDLYYGNIRPSEQKMTANSDLQRAVKTVTGCERQLMEQIRRGQLTAFSLERLIGYLNKLDQDVEIIIKAKPFSRKDHGHLNVAFG